MHSPLNPTIISFRMESMHEMKIPQGTTEIANQEILRGIGSYFNHQRVVCW
jgi:hypothetical protein